MTDQPPPELDEIEALAKSLEAMSRSAFALGGERAKLERAADTIRQLREQVRDAVVVLGRCGESFRLYEAMHAEKSTLEGDAKARRNAVLAEMCEAVHSKLGE